MTNPLLQESTLPYKLPDFAHLTPAHFRQAFEQGMQDQLTRLHEIAADPSPATEENVLAAWDRADVPLTRAIEAFWAMKASDSNDELEALYTEFAPRWAAHEDAITLDRPFYDRLAELRRRADAGEVALDAQADWFLGELMRKAERSGVQLDADAQVRLKELNTRLAELSTVFERNNRESRNAGGIDVTVDELDGLTDDEIASLKREDGTYRIDLVNTSQQPMMEKLKNRDLRRRLYEASVTRATSGEFDNRQVIVDIARARAERATLLGFEHHAALVASKGCAKTSEAVEALMGPLGPASLAQAKKDAVDLAARFAELYPGEEFAAWDWAYVAELVRAERYDLDPAELDPYLQVDKVQQAVYDAAEALYGITFHKMPELRGHTEATDVYEVRNADGSPVGLFCMDFWARPNKEGGAWMTSIVDQSHLGEALPVVTNDCNYTPTTTTISWDGVITMFHEFGHALHGLFSDSRYAATSGTSTPQDFVEFPSQVNEHWAWEPDRVVPAELAAKLREAMKFNQGFQTLELMGATLPDQSWHTTPLDELPTSADEVEAFERAALERWGVAYDLVPPRYRSTYFSHIWGGGYAAAYYGYKWSEVMDADAVAWFDENGGGTRENGDYFRRTLLAPGGSVDPMETYRAFRGRDPEVGPLLERLGLEI